VSCERAVLLADADEVDPNDPHVAGCADCQAQLAAMRRIARAMRDIGSDARRAPDHLERVWATLDREVGTHLSHTSRTRRKTMIGVGAAAGILAMAAGTLLWLRRPAPAPRFAVDVINSSEGAAIRGDAHLNDRLRVRARADRAVTVRVYRNDSELLLECPRACRREGDTLVGDVALDAIARYQVLWIEGATPPPATTLDADIASVTAAGARYDLRELEVR
jgi:hypothetical protein